MGTLVCFSLKTFPMDCRENGDLPADPQKTMKDGFGDAGRLVAFCAGRFIEKKWF